ncbi:MAG: isoleucine--tRNA ligase [Candidatus Gastranaerophilales bacterium]|nr:isoleucine--tRNA ligase [Candidatus Gastranaerophilales bacterium]
MENKKEYKDTLNLPSTTLAMRANAAIRELEIQKFWEENKIYEKNLAQRDKKNSFILHDGPPYLSSDKIHIGHALNKILKDIIIKHKAQKGYYANYVPGYDAHGLPIENAVAKTIKGGKDAISPYELRQKCREFALKNLKGQEANFKRLGVLGDWENPYITIAPDYEAQQVKVFGEIYKKGFIQKGLKPVYWCPHCETALAEAEVEYQDITSDSIYVKFEISDKSELAQAFNLDKLDKKAYMVIWTTTPWTIPSNLAISVHPNYEYGLYYVNDEYWVIACSLLEAFAADTGKTEDDFELAAKTQGSSLENINTKHPILERFSTIITGEHVTLDAGTGAVHTAPGHGLEDWEVCQKYGIKTFSPLDKKGRWTGEVKELEGVYYQDGNEIVMQKLEQSGALVKKSPITHSYPHCWRCKQPVIYRATPQWFVKVGDFMEQSLNAIKNVKWIPQAGEKRISNMVANRTDWCISRQRAWGVPIPVLYCKKCNKPMINDETIDLISGIFEKESSDSWVKYGAEKFVPEGTKCECGCEDFEKETDIMDVWFDSGISWRAVVEKRSGEFTDKKSIPVDMYLEGSDQHRGWFQSSLLTCAATVGIAPYKEVLCHGFVLDGEGRKMSKSLGNVVLPQEVIKVYGADVLRLWAASVDYRNDIKIGQNIINQLVEVFKKTRNTARFLLGNLFDFDPEKDYVEYDKLKSIDKFALSKLNNLIKNVDEAFEEYEFYKYFQYLQNFATVDLSSFYLDIVKDRLYTAGKNSLSRRACQTVLYEILQTITRILVPVMPHQAEDIWQNMPDCQKNGLESILLSSWTKTNSRWENKELEAEYGELLKIREITTKAIEPLRASVNKIIGSSLEADVLITCENSALLEKYKNELGDLFIVSHVYIGEKPDFNAIHTFEQDGIKIQVSKASGEKCQRCWKYRNLNKEGICDDCAEAVSDIVLKN